MLLLYADWDMLKNASNQGGANTATVAPWHTAAGDGRFESCIYRKLFGG